MSNKWEIVPMELGWLKMPMNTLIFDELASDEENDRVWQVPILSFLLTNTETGEKRLIDCGADSDHPECNAAWQSSPGWGVHTAADSLKKLGIAPEEITKIYITHMHWDHAYGLKDFPNAKVVVQKDEIEYGCDLNNRGYKCPYDGLFPNRPRPFFLQYYSQMEFVNGDVDFGDGIRVYTVPGHSAGSQAIFVEGVDGNYFFPGDVMYIQACYEKGRPSGGLYDVKLAFQTVKKAKQIIAENNATFVPSHHAYALDMFAKKVCMNQRPADALA